MLLDGVHSGEEGHSISPQEAIHSYSRKVIKYSAPMCCHNITPHELFQVSSVITTSVRSQFLVSISITCTPYFLWHSNICHSIVRGMKLATKYCHELVKYVRACYEYGKYAKTFETLESGPQYVVLGVSVESSYS